MQLNGFTDYALRVLVYAAASPDRLCTAQEVSTAFGVSRHHLVKVVNELQHLGHLETVRGRVGGFKLARPAAAIRVGDVVRGAEANLTVVECFDGATNTCPLTRACGLKGVMREAVDAFFDVLDRYSLADLVGDPRWRGRVLALAPTARRAHA